MGVLKDALHLAVVQHLKNSRNNQTLVLSLNAPNGIGPDTIRVAWANLKENGKPEGMNKTTGLKKVLEERLDLFYFHTNERGHNLVTLAPDVAATECLVLPSKGPNYVPPASIVTPVPPTRPAAVLPNLKQELLPQPEEVEPKKKKAKTGTSYNGGGKAMGGKGWYGYNDVVWTPEISALNKEAKKKDAAMARALFNIATVHGGRKITVSQLGADFTVGQLKKDPQFQNHKLIDILRYHDEVFELVPDSGIGGFVVNLTPDAVNQLPDAGTYVKVVDENEALLPVRIENPISQAQKMQAMRIELVHVIYRRGNKCALNECGQDQKVQKIKAGLPKALKLIDFFRQFPGNFEVAPGDGGLMDITLINADCSDTSMIERNIVRAAEATERFRAKGLSKGKARPGSVGVNSAAPAPGAFSSREQETAFTSAILLQQRIVAQYAAQAAIAGHLV